MQIILYQNKKTAPCARTYVSAPLIIAIDVYHEWCVQPQYTLVKILNIIII